MFQKPKNAMQSGRAQTDKWGLEFEPADAQRPDPLTSWAGSADTRRQVKLMFPTLEAAKAYAEREGITYHVVPAPQRTLKIQRSEEHTSELQSLMRISYAVFCLKNKKQMIQQTIIKTLTTSTQ